MSNELDGEIPSSISRLHRLPNITLVPALIYYLRTIQLRDPFFRVKVVQ
jgi:hypothetical protein